jgi:hypothetical protein
MLAATKTKKYIMGAWGTKTFEDDSALDWYDEFCQSDQSVDLLKEAFEKVIQTKEYLDHDEGIATLVAAEILAAALNKPSQQFPQADYHLRMKEAEQEGEEGIEIPLPDLNQIQSKLDAGLLEKAIEAVAKVQHYEHSELRELWEDSAHYQEWKAELESLQERLK